MLKIKNNKSIIKRFKLTKNKLKRKKSFSNHFLLKKKGRKKIDYNKIIYKKNITWG